MSEREDYESEVVQHLKDEGRDALADFMAGGAMLTELDVGTFLDALDDLWIVRVRNDDEERQYARATNGDLAQIRDNGRDGDFGRPFGAYVDEFEDIVFSGKYRVDIIYPEDAAFEVAEA